MLKTQAKELYNLSQAERQFGLRINGRHLSPLETAKIYLKNQNRWTDCNMAHFVIVL